MQPWNYVKTGTENSSATWRNRFLCKNSKFYLTKSKIGFLGSYAWNDWTIINVDVTFNVTTRDFLTYLCKSMYCRCFLFLPPCTHMDIKRKCWIRMNKYCGGAKGYSVASQQNLWEETRFGKGSPVFPQKSAAALPFTLLAFRVQYSHSGERCA